MIINPSWTPHQALRWSKEAYHRKLSKVTECMAGKMSHTMPWNHSSLLPWSSIMGVNQRDLPSLQSANSSSIRHKCVCPNPPPHLHHMDQPWAGMSLPLSFLARNHHLRSAFLACCAVFLPLCTKHKCKGAPTYMFRCLYTRLHVQAMSFSFS